MTSAGARNGLHGGRGKRLVIALPYLWLLTFFLLPFLLVLKISLAEPMLAQPPYSSLVSAPRQGELQINLFFGNYRFLVSDPLYLAAYLKSLKIAAISTLIALLIGYPMAYGIARAAPRRRLALLLLVMLPFWTSFLIRIYAWIALLKTNGLINQLLLAIGIVDSPLALLYTDLAIYIGIVYAYLPFMVLPIYATLVRQDPALLDAASDLGARPWRTFTSVTLPLSWPGVLAGSLLVFIPAVGEFVIPDLLGGPDSIMIGKILWTEFFSNRDWPVASAVAIAMLLLLVVPLAIFRRIEERATEDAEPR